MAGNMLTKTIGTGNDTAVTKMEYDGLGRMLKMTKPEGGVYTYSYDMLGRKTSETAPNGGVTSYVYDDSGRLIEQSSPLTSNSNKSVKKYTYDKNSNVLTESIKNSLPGSTDTYRTTTYTYDDRNNMIKVQNGSGSNASYTEYEYDGVGNVLKEKAANGANVTSYTYDSKYRLTKMQDPMGLCEEYGYDNAGNMIYKKDKNGTTLKYDYDAMCRITKEYAVSGNSEVIKKMYTYNDKNNISEINDNKTRFIYGYHSKYNRLASVSMYQDNKRTYMTYGYDGRGNMTSKFISIFLKNFVNDNVSLVQYMYTYDKNDNMTKQTYKMSSKDSYKDFASYSYDNMDRLVKETRGDITTSYTYNMAGLVTGLTNKKGSNVISTYSNTYNYDGNVAKAVENGVTKNYTYDNMNRLVSEIIGGDEYTYSYDVSGNRTRLDVELSDDYSYCTTYKYDKNNRLLNTFKTENLNSYITDYYYDNNGNQITKVSSEIEANGDNQSLGIKTAGELSENQRSEYFTYNVFNQLKEYRNTEGTKATYEYAVNGYRYSKSVNGSVTKYIWDGENIVAEMNSDYTDKNIYLYGKDMAADSEGNNYLYDIHGSVTDIINVEGNKVKNYEYDAFGNVEAESNASNENPWQYCGEYRDSESGLIYLRNRYYDSETGRFISEDPIRSGGNWYSYCVNNPLMFIDPSGLEVDTLRNLASSTASALGCSYEIKTDNKNNKATVTIGKGTYDLSGTFYYDGTAEIDGKKTDDKIARNKDGTLVMDRSDFYTAMGIQNESSIETKTSKGIVKMIVTFSISAVTGAAVKLVMQDLVGSMVIGYIVTDKVTTLVGSKMLDAGDYQFLTTVGEVYNKKTGLYESIVTKDDYKMGPYNEKNEYYRYSLTTEKDKHTYETSIFDDTLY